MGDSKKLLLADLNVFCHVFIKSQKNHLNVEWYSVSLHS